jgi:hypothetical protein
MAVAPARPGTLRLMTLIAAFVLEARVATGLQFPSWLLEVKEIAQFSGPISYLHLLASVICPAPSRWAPWAADRRDGGTYCMRLTMRYCSEVNGIAY